MVHFEIFIANCKITIIQIKLTFTNKLAFNTFCVENITYKQNNI